MQEESRRKINKAIESNKNAIKNPFHKKSLALDPTQLDRDKSRDREKINIFLNKLKAQHNDLLPFVKKIRSRLEDITESTHICAVYLLLCHIFNNWNSVFILAENGKSSAVGNIIRMIKESNMQVQLFALDFQEGNHENIKKWFSGEIIDYSVGRQKMDKYVSTPSSLSDFNLKELATHIYQIESQFSHNAYSTVLELVSPFSEDYDDNYTGYYRTIALLKYALGSLEGTNIALSIVYSAFIQDEQDLKSLDEILTKYKTRIFT